MLFSNARAESKGNTYRVGQKHFEDCIFNHDGLVLTPFRPKRLSLGGLTLCFFIASLFADESAKSQKTIRGYVSHVKVAWAIGGWKLAEFDSWVVGQILRGVERLRPSKPDVRAALLLPHLPFPRYFKVPLNKNQLLLKAATILGFLGMFRFHTYARLTTENLVVRKDGRETNLMSGSAAKVRGHFDRKGIGILLQIS